MYIYIHIYVRTHTYTYIHIYIYVCICICMHTYTHTHIHTCMHTYIRTYVHTYTHSHLLLLSVYSYVLGYSSSSLLFVFFFTSYIRNRACFGINFVRFCEFCGYLISGFWRLRFVEPLGVVYVVLCMVWVLWGTLAYGEVFGEYLFRAEGPRLLRVVSS